MYENTFSLSVIFHTGQRWEGSVSSDTLQWRHNERDGVPNQQPHDCLLKRLFRSISKKTSKHRVTGLRAGNSPLTDEFPAQRASYAENVSIWWHHHEAHVYPTVSKIRETIYRADSGGFNMYYLTSKCIRTIKIKRSHDRPKIFMIGIPVSILVRRRLCIKSAR